MGVLEPLADRGRLADGRVVELQHRHPVGGIELAQLRRPLERIDLQQFDLHPLLGERHTDLARERRGFQDHRRGIGTSAA